MRAGVNPFRPGGCIASDFRSLILQYFVWLMYIRYGNNNVKICCVLMKNMTYITVITIRSKYIMRLPLQEPITE